MTAPPARDVKVFVPAKSFETSRRFYTALGWTENWVHDGGLAELKLAGHRLYLQNFYAKDWAENFMIYVVVDDAQAWFDHVTDVIASGDFDGARVAPPKHEDHGALVTYVWDPSGVLLHLAQPVA